MGGESGWDRGERVTYGSEVGSARESGSGWGSQNPHPLSQRARKKDGASQTANTGGDDTEAALGDGGGGVSGEGGGVGAAGIKALGREFAVRPDCGQREEAAAGASQVFASGRERWGEDLTCTRSS